MVDATLDSEYSERGVLALELSMRFTLALMRTSGTAPLGRLLLDAFKWFDESLRASLKEQGWPEISRAQSLAMAYLDGEGTRISELARRLGVSRQAAQKSVKELEDAKLVKTAVDPRNLSAKTVVLTSQGKAIVAAALNAFARIELQLSRRVGSSEVARLRATLARDWGPPVVVKK